MQASNQIRRTSLSSEVKTYMCSYYPNQNQNFSISVRNTTRQINQNWLEPLHKYEPTNNRNYPPSYVITNTVSPSMITLQAQKNILTNAGSISLSKLYNIGLENALYLFHSLLNQFIILYQKYGQSYFDIEDWCLSKEGVLMMKQKAPNIYLQGKSFEEPAIVDQIIDYIKEISWRNIFDDFYSFFKRAQSKNKCDYKYTLSLVQLYCKFSKILMKKKYDFAEKLNQKELRPEAIVSPSKTISSLNHQKYSNQRVKTVSDENSGEFQLSYHESKSQQKRRSVRNSILNIKKSADISKKHRLKEYLNRMTHSNEIKNVSSKNNFQNDINIQKESVASTSNKTVSFSSFPKKDCSQSQTSISNGKNQGIKNVDKIKIPFLSNCKQVPCSLEANLELVQSQSQSSDNQRQEQFCQKGYQNNQWTRTFNDLLNSKKQVAESFIDGKDQVIDKRGNPEFLGKLARVVVQSFLNTQNSSRSQQQMNKIGFRIQ